MEAVANVWDQGLEADGRRSPADGQAQSLVGHGRRGLWGGGVGVFLGLLAWARLGATVPGAELPPEIITRPVSLVVTQGQVASFTVEAGGSEPLAYQWRYEAQPIPGATSSVYSIASAQPQQEGNYDVVVTNLFGSATSKAATLTVLEPPRIQVQPVSLVVTQGNSATLTVTAAGDPPLSYQWRFGGSPLPAATGPVLTLLDVQAGQTGGYDVVVSNPYGSVTSAVAMVEFFIPLQIVQQPASLVVTQGTEARFTVVATGNSPLRYQWQRQGAAIAAATNPVYVVAAAQALQAGSYRVVVSNSLGAVTSQVATLTVLLPPRILTGPVSLTVTQGQSAAFTVVAEGDSPLNYQWRFQGNPIAGATGASHTITDAQADDEGDYDVVVSNAVGRVTSAAASLTVTALLRIVQHPVSLVVTQGESARFEVVAEGVAPLSYQWRFEGHPIPGATSPSYNIASAGPAQQGSYSVTVSNSAGSVSSLDALLTVLVPPTILSQPVSQTVPRGGTARLEVVASDPEPLTYQWFFQGAPLTGANGAVLTVDGAELGDAGEYWVEVANSAAGLRSGSAVLTVWEMDFGDAPAGAYQTLLANDGARHRVVAGYHLGALVDDEPDGQPQSSGLGDDMAGTDDEDGVSFVGPLLRGAATTVQVVASSNGLLQAWVDFDRNLSWADPGEQVLVNQAVVAGTNLLQFAVPAGAALGQTFARFRFSSRGDLGIAGLAVDGEVEDHAVSIQMPVELRVTQSDGPDPVGVGTNVTYLVAVTNRGLTTATGVVLSNTLAAGMSFVSAVPSQGSCAFLGGTVRCDLGSLAPGGRTTVSVTARPLAPGMKTNVVMVAANEIDGNPADNRSVQTTSVLFVVPPLPPNSQLIEVLEDGGPALLYPSTIFVSGLTTAVYKVTVTLHRITHTYPDDLDILLVAPGGYGIILMSDAGGDGSLSGVTLTFDDDSPLNLPDRIDEGQSPITGGTYRPTNYGSDDTFPAPAPAGPYGFDLSFFEGINPNGAWSLYVVDDLALDFGKIEGGWSLRLTTMEPIADLGLQITDTPDPVTIGSNLTYSILVTNLGPAAANSTTLHQGLPAGLEVISASSSQGSCSVVEGELRCSLGRLLARQGALVTVVARPTVGGRLVVPFSVNSLETDPEPDNDLISVVTDVKRLADLAVGQTAQPVPALVQGLLTYTVSVTNQGPDGAAEVRLVDQLPATATFVSAVSTQGACTNQGGTVTCLVGELGAGGRATATIVCQPTMVGQITNQVTVSSVEIDPQAANNSAMAIASVLPSTDLVLRMADAPDPVNAGEPLVYTLTVSNRGPNTASGVRLEDTLPAGAALVTSGASQGACRQEGGLVICDLGSLGVNGQAAITIEVIPSLAGSATNRAAVTAVEGDLRPADNVAAAQTLVVPVADLQVRMSDSSDPIPLRDRVTYTMEIINLGPSRATGLRLTNSFPAGTELVQTLTTQGVCTLVAGQVFCNLGSLESGGTATVSVVVRPLETGIITNRATVAAYELDPNPTNNQTMESTAVLVAVGVFSNPEPITINTTAPGPATPYPSTILVSGLTVRVDRVTVTLSNLNHSYADDLDVLLVGPLGQAILLLSDVGGSTVLSNVSLSLADGASAELPDSGPFESGAYRPTNHGGEPDLFAEPAPPGPYGTSLAVLEGLDPNGTWSLYVADDAEKDSGQILGGWQVQFSTRTPALDLVVSAGQAPDPTAANGVMTYTVAVSNAGPSSATGVTLRDTLPAGVNLISVVPSQGSFSFAAGEITCLLGALPVEASATVSIVVSYPVPGLFTNRTEAIATETDRDMSNNTTDVVTTVLDPVRFIETPLSTTVNAGDVVTFRALASGSGPIGYQWRWNGRDLAGATNTVLVISNVTYLDVGVYRVVVSNPASAVESEPASLFVQSPPLITAQPETRTNFAGSVFLMRVIAVGTPPLSYQWFDGAGKPIAGATNSSFAIPNVQVTDSGDYHARLYNYFGTTTSQVARLTVLEADFGDAPQGYPTRVAGGGAYHLLRPGMHLGAGVDFEADAHASNDATGDDLEGMDDEDGVFFLTPLWSGLLASVQVSASTNGVLDAFVDFNRNGSWAEPAERVLQSVPVAAGDNFFSFPVPLTAQPGTSFARFRFSQAGGLGPGGPAPAGEVEDYMVEIVGASDLALTARDDPDPVAVGQVLVYTTTITNRGPGRATAVYVTNEFASGLNFVSAVADRGFCSVNSGRVICSLGSVSAGESLRVIASFSPTSPGLRELRSLVGSPEADLNQEDNQALLTTMVMLPPVIIQQPQQALATNGATVVFSVTATGTEPLHYQWLMNGNPVFRATNALLTLSNAGPAQVGSYSVEVTNAVGRASSLPVILRLGNRPTAVTDAAQSVTSTGAVLRARITAGGLLATAWFQWGSSTNYDRQTLARTYGSGTNLVLVSDVVGGALPNTEHRFRVVATNSLGTVFGQDQSWIWRDTPRPEILSVARLPDGQVRLEFSAPEGQVHLIRASTDLASWWVLGTPTPLGAGRFEFLDEEAASRRFYDVFSP